MIGNVTYVLVAVIGIAAIVENYETFFYSYFVTKSF